MKFATIFLLSFVILIGDFEHGNAASCSSACPPAGNPVTAPTCTKTAVRYGSRRSWFRRRTYSYQGTETLCCPGYNLKDGRCHRPINECTSSPCKNGGICTDQTFGFTCKCSAAYYGTLCENRRIMSCSFDCPAPAGVLEMNHCTKSGVAYRSRRSWFRRRTVSYQTTVKACCPGFNLVNNDKCRIQSNGCNTGPCRNGGSCIARGTTYQCTCPAGFYGKNCDSTTFPNENIWYNDNANKCGLSKYPNAGEQPLPSATIVGGVSARVNEFPWQAMLAAEIENEFRIYCGAVIINKYWLLTAAACIEGYQQYRKHVFVGIHRIQQQDSTQKQHIVQRAIAHPSHNAEKFDYDIGLLRTATPMEFDEDVHPVCPPEDNLNYDHRKAVASGWGANLFSGPFQNTLQYITLNVTTEQFCKLRHANSGVPITSRMLCTWDNRGGTERSTCKGDAGGPLTVKEASGQFRVVGISSWIRHSGDTCDAGFPAVFARVTEFMSWIDRTVPQNDRM